MAKTITEQSRRRAIEALRRKARERPNESACIDTLMGYLRGDSVSGENDRSTVLLLTAILEHGLEIAILTHCINMDEIAQRKFFGSDPSQASMTLDIKIRLAYALGVFGPKTMGDLECIRSIRNLFAHFHHHVSFSMPEIVDICNEIQIAKKFDRSTFTPLADDSPRSNFIFSILILFMLLITSWEDGGKGKRYINLPLPEMLS